MKEFMDENFLLQTKTAQELFHEHAKDMPIYDYHCHLSAKEIAEDIKFDNIGQAWLAGDHYKWRAMRTNGISEKYCTGDASDYEKFEKWAETIPMTIRNPLYHWTHLELQRFFNINSILSPNTCKEIYEKSSELLNSSEYSVRNIMKMMNVKIICTTDDPVDSLEHHQKIKEEGFEVKVLPTFRPDKAMAVNNLDSYNEYIKKLIKASKIKIHDFSSLIEAIDRRHGFFHDIGCRIADHGVEYLYAEEYALKEIDAIFIKVVSNKRISNLEINKFKSAFLYETARLNNKRGWVQQFHLGPFRNNNTRMFKNLGPDTGYDSIGDFNQGASMVKFLDKLDETNELAKTILYNINPRDNALIASMIGNFQDGSSPGKIQFGSGWWFLDQKDGMEAQMNALSNMGLLSRFIGMTTDSRSFLSYPRHEYFRRILCNLIGNDVENGEIPADMELLGKLVEDISYNNAVNYFGIEL